MNASRGEVDIISKIIRSHYQPSTEKVHSQLLCFNKQMIYNYAR